MANEYRISTVAAEVLRNAVVAPARVSTNAAEVFHGGQPVLRVSTNAAEVFHGGQPILRISTFAVEVLRSIGASPAVIRRRRSLIIN